MAWLLPLLFIVILYSLYYFFTRTFNYWKDRNVAYAKPLPFVGNLLEPTLRREFHGKTYRRIYNQFPNEKVVGVFRMTTPCLLIKDLEILKHIMIKDFDQFADRGVELSKKGLGANLFSVDGDTWRLLRTRFSPLFTSGKLRNMTYLLTERVDKFSDYVESVVSENPEQEVHKLLQLYTLTTISACAFGMDVEVRDSQVKILKSFDKNIFSLSYFMEFEMMFPGVLKKLDLSIFGANIRNFFGDLVTTVIRERNDTPSGRNDFMDLILEMRQENEIVGLKRSNQEELRLELSEDVIAAQAFIFYAAGYETSATTMAFMLYHLANNQDIQNKLIAEVDKVLEKHDGKITYDSVKEMTYLGNVFDETLRVHPIVDVLQRCAQSDYKVPGVDLVIKKGQYVLVSTSGIHFDEKYYKNPEKFDPDRFSAENSKDLHPCAFIPFGIGPRNCIGLRFGKLQSRVCIAKLMSKFRVEVSNNTPKEMTYSALRILCGPENGIPLKFVSRK